MRGIGALPVNVPEWKRKAFGGNQVSYGKRTELSILQQRENLPIFKLKGQLVQVRAAATRFRSNGLAKGACKTEYLSTGSPR